MGKLMLKLEFKSGLPSHIPSAIGQFLFLEKGQDLDDIEQWQWIVKEKLQTWPNAYFMFFHDSISACTSLPLKIINTFAINIHLAIRKKLPVLPFSVSIFI